ncbi:hypothetical protein [Ruminococcus sp. HUN007]|uniref:hypothetical protein n=1 Tax=Ruminococcus sp. HUN007 TaxID=1514668 RepID=UPI0005D16ECF|nr:hypothetical protein [Ruminococcus sp. HUN007]
MYKFYCILLFSVLLLSSCSGSSTNKSDTIDSLPTTNSPNINIECESDIFTDTENTSDFIVTEKQDTDKSYSIDHNEFYEEDKETILNICNDICKDLKELYSYDRIIQYDTLKEYLKYSVTNSAFDAIPDGTGLYLSLQSLTIETKNALVTGLLKDSTGAYGECTIILSNNAGEILLNDIALDTKGSSDTIYRPDFLHSPYPDFWLEYSNYSWIAEQTLSNIQ